MFRDERTNDTVLALIRAMSGWQQGIWTAMPGILQSFDATAVTATVQPAIQAQVLLPDAQEYTPQTLPLLIHCPVIFPGGGGYGLTFPLVSGDEGLVVFASRCIDAWWQSGGVQPQAEVRMHDLSDGFFLPGVFSQARKPSAAIPTTGAALRANDGSVYIEARADGFHVLGDITVTGGIHTTGDVVAGSISLKTHKHGGVVVGGAQTGVPV